MVTLDDADRKLIEELQRDGRIPITALSTRLGIHRVTLQYRLRRLQKHGVIRRFTVLVDRELTGTDFTAFALVNVALGSVDQKAIGEAITKVPGVVEVHDVTGRPDFVIKVRASSLREIGERVDRVRSIPGVASTETFPSVISYKEET